MTDERTAGLTPALTPEQWAALEEYTERNFGGADQLLAAYLLGECTVHYDPKRPDALAAVALAALPAGHPGKITQAMVEALTEAVATWRAEGSVFDEAAPEWRAMNAALAALRALLPRAPEGEMRR